MAGLVPAIHATVVADTAEGQDHMAGGWIYIMTNRPNGVLYVGVTSDLGRRAPEHREGLADGFTKRYGLSVWCTPSATMTSDGDTAREEYEILAADLEGSANPRNKSGLG
jgi:predicted GIY-YIG superfamily endonuclease